MSLPAKWPSGRLNVEPALGRSSGCLSSRWAHEVVHGGANLLRVSLVQVKRRGEHHHPVGGNAAAAIAQLEVGRVNGVEGAVRHHHAHALENVRDAPAVGAGVHEARAAHRARDPARELEAGESQLAGHLRSLAQVHAGLARHLRAVDRDANQPVRHRHDHAAVALVRDQQVRAAAQDKALGARLVAGAQDVPDLVEVLGNHVEVRRAAHLEGGVFAHGLVNEDVLLADDGAKAPGKRLSTAIALGHVDLSTGTGSPISIRGSSRQKVIRYRGQFQGGVKVPTGGDGGVRAPKSATRKKGG